jgi:hypothetical protein
MLKLVVMEKVKDFRLKEKAIKNLFLNFNNLYLMLLSDF